VLWDVTVFFKGSCPEILRYAGMGGLWRADRVCVQQKGFEIKAETAELPW